MRKSLIVIASALIVAVGAAGTHRLRYDSTVFASRGELTESRRAAREYPPCIRGVREDRCIQLYERGVRRSYQRWLAERGVTGRPRSATASRAYPPCRSRSDDRCQQRASGRRAAVRTARAGTPARAVRRAQQQRTAARATPPRVRRSQAPARAAATRRPSPPRATATRRATNPARAATRAPARVTPRQQARPTPRPQTRPAQRPTQPQPPNTPGI